MLRSKKTVPVLSCQSTFSVKFVGVATCRMITLALAFAKTGLVWAGLHNNGPGAMENMNLQKFVSSDAQE